MENQFSLQMDQQPTEVAIGFGGCILSTAFIHQQSFLGADEIT